MTARDQDLPHALSQLDQLAFNIATAVNAQNNAGADLAGNSGNAGGIFYQPAQIAGSAESMAVVMGDPNHVAAASVGAGSGDNSNANSLAALSDQYLKRNIAGSHELQRR